MSTLSEEERAQLRALEEEHRDLLPLLENLESDLSTLSKTRDRLTADLESNLLKRREELELSAGLNEIQTSGGAGGRDFTAEIEVIESELRHIQAAQIATENEMKEIVELITRKRTETAAFERSLEERKAKELAIQEQLVEATKMLDKLLNKRSILLETVSSKQKLIRDLGTVPRRELEEFKALNEKQLLKRLKVN